MKEIHSIKQGNNLNNLEKDKFQNLSKLLEETLEEKKLEIERIASEKENLEEKLRITSADYEVLQKSYTSLQESVEENKNTITQESAIECQKLSQELTSSLAANEELRVKCAAAEQRLENIRWEYYWMYYY